MNPGDTGVFHESERLAFCLEPCDELLGVHAELDELESHDAFDGLLLLRFPYLAHAALAQGTEQGVATDGRRTAGVRTAGAERTQLRLVASGLPIVGAVVLSHAVCASVESDVDDSLRPGCLPSVPRGSATSRDVSSRSATRRTGMSEGEAAIAQARFHGATLGVC